MTRRYRAFISYSWADREWAEWLHRTLETYRTPRALIGAEGALGAIPERLTPIFKDREEEAAGHGITAAIEAALAESEFLIVLCSPNSAQSKWVNREIAWFKTNRDKRRILAIVVDGEPMASLKGDEAAECFPKALIYEVGDDLQPTERLEDPPLAADARKEGDGKRLAKLKLAAALMGSGLDALVRRDERRRAVRRRFVTGAAFALAAIFAGISVFAFNQRDAAIAARNEAVAAQAEAEFQKDEAQGLVEFMLTDLRKRLDAVGRLDILDAVAERLNESYAKQDLSKLDPDSLGRRARVQLLLGEVDNTRGNLDAALAQYKEAAASTEELLKRNPGKAQQIFDHAQSVFWVGYIAWQRGDAAEAKAYWRRYKQYAEELVAIDPENEDWHAEIDYANSNLGTLAMDQGEAAEAESYFRKSLEVSTRLAEAHPNDTQRQIALGQSYAWLADSLHRQTKLDEARKKRLAEIEIYKRRLDRDENNTVLQSALSVANYRLAQIEMAAGDIDSASEYAKKAADGLFILYGHDPQSAGISEKASFSYSVLGESYFYSGRLVEARSEFAKALKIAESLVEKDSNVAQWSGQNVAQSKLFLARIEPAEKAIRLLNEVEQSLRPTIASSSADPIVVRRYCLALASLAKTDSNSAGNWQRVVNLLEGAMTRQGPEALALLVEAYHRTGKSDQSRSIAMQLFVSGYRHPDFMSLLDEFPDLKTAAMTGIAQ